jgi:protein-tyrosine-phosphatase
MRRRLIRRIELLENTVKPRGTEMPPEALEILRMLGVKVPGNRPKDKVTAKKDIS